MRAVVFLCLLEAAFIQAQKFHWNPVTTTTSTATRTTTPHITGTTLTEDYNDNLCLENQEYCSCCFMHKNLHRIDEQFNSVFDKFQKELKNTEMVYEELTTSRSAFSVTLVKDFKCVGPFLEKTVIVYEHVFVNLGNNYDVTTGIFTAPRTGVYSLSLTVFSDAGSPGNTIAACADITVNNVAVAGPKEYNNADGEDSATVVLAKELIRGDEVAVILLPGCFLCDDDNHYNTFTGFLLYPTGPRP